MIPKKKKSPAEIVALREGLGIPDSIPPLGSPGQRSLPISPPSPATPELPTPPPKKANKQTPAPENRTAPSSDNGKSDSKSDLLLTAPPEAQLADQPLPILDPAHPDQSPVEVVDLPLGEEEIVHLDLPSDSPTPVAKIESQPIHSLRKNELPLAPAPAVTQKTALPAQRHAQRDIEEIRRREALGHLSANAQDPAMHLRSITAHPLLLSVSYGVAIGAAAAASRTAHPITPLALIVLSITLAGYIFIKKKRSRHHAAFLAIIIIMTLVFGGLHYAPLFNYGP
ncbi:hypothetical protein ACFSSA_14820 [Luteolibacter algae]|uniref:Uncharacterized protein n=1 Tax=Luteolibacter algae TaxID=454151 RepID=A0ABW5DAM0_9BACT